MRYTKIPLLFFILALLIGCEEEKSKSPTISRTQVIMGTFCRITLEEQHAKEIEIGFSHLKKIESTLSSYQKEALVSKLNTYKTVQTNPILKDILEKSKYYYKKTHGYFDITIGSISKKLYRFGEDERIPSTREIHLAPVGIRHLKISNNTISLEENITIDLGGIGKGYGVDNLANYYKTKGINKGQLALSGDIRCLNKCVVGIQSPFEENSLLTTLYAKVPNLSISTSGTYRRYVKEKKHHHLINPKTKTQGKAFVSVTIVTQENNTLCDVMATAISTMPKEVALNFVKSQKKFGYVLVTPEGEMILGNLENFVSLQRK